MLDWWRQRSLFARFLAYAIIAILALFVAAGLGAGAALVVKGDLSRPAGVGGKSEKSGSASERGASHQRNQAGADRSQKEETGARRSQAAPRDDRNTYVHDVGRIQAASVETLLDSHEKLLRYDALTPGDIEKMRANKADLQRLADQASALGAPKKYGHQKEAFVSAIEELHRAARLAYALAADPTSATESGFRKYDGRVDKAAALLKQSNGLLGRDYETIEGVRSVGTSQ
jgi:hypothetical protein